VIRRGHFLSAIVALFRDQWSKPFRGYATLISAVRSMIVQKKSPDECGAKYREETAPSRGKSR
jgi:hypothetical protein